MTVVNSSRKSSTHKCTTHQRQYSADVMCEVTCEIIRNNRAARQENLIGQLNPVIAGWSRFYRAVVSKAVFQRLDNLLYLRLARWARRRHPHKGRRWIA